MNEHANPQQFSADAARRNSEVYERRDEPGVWATESFGSDGECYVTAFYGPASEARAREYAEFKSGQ